MTLFVFSILLIGLLGYLAQTTGLCLVRGVNEALAGKPMFLFSIVMSGSLAWISILIGYLVDVETPFISYEYSILAVVGGFLFGLGASLNGGCGVSTISKLARGQLVMALTINGWLVGWLLLASFSLDYRISPYQIELSLHTGILVCISVFILLCTIKMTLENRKLWLSMLGIGLCAGIVFLHEPKWTPSGLLKDVSLSLWYEKSEIWPDDSRFILIGALIIGMLLAALHKKTFDLVALTSRSSLKHFLAGCLMGVGAAIASGGNDSQLLLGLPSLSPAGITTVLCMLAGIAVGLKLSMVLTR
ncbi:YeeE/YedE thiosulfate transporter family protein [Shewanella pneumatophori]|uniref:YeeE/YedE family protein n=1 Tax=Shewanella pneumatophori TaxID=314092 RepID=A0A9X1ZCD1_9GAMM|nr:YeeE/YedE thiosulfate transporter family protein [Shewanella pneumatophori]MCL1137197.1 YeeE/YedE family protein [Shewanella pneumatophori]